jgi:hypothetical protein
MHRPIKQDAEQGQALIEFMLTVPILFMLVFGIIDLARMMFAFSQVIDAARQGVRYGIVEGLDKGNYQYLDCNGIEDAARDTPGLVPGDDLTIDITYERTTNGTKIVKCSERAPTLNDIKDGAVLAVQVTGELKPITPLLALFDDSIAYDYTSRRTIANQGAYYTDEWPSAPPVPYDFQAVPDCTTGRVAFFWRALTIWPERIEIRDSFTGQTVVTINYPETQYAYCQDNVPYWGRSCGVTIDTDDGYGMWYMAVIDKGLEGTSSVDATALCEGGGGGGPGDEGGTADINGLVYNDGDSDCLRKNKAKDPGIANLNVKAYDAGPDGSIITTGDNVLLATVQTDDDGAFSFTDLPIPVGPPAQQDFSVVPDVPAGLPKACNSPAYFFNVVNGNVKYVQIGFHP